MKNFSLTAINACNWKAKTANFYWLFFSDREEFFLDLFKYSYCTKGLSNSIPTQPILITTRANTKFALGKIPRAIECRRQHLLWPSARQYRSRDNVDNLKAKAPRLALLWPLKPQAFEQICG